MIESELYLYSAIVFVAALAGGLVTLVRKWSYENLHLFLSLGAGVFLGVVFLYLLPESFADHMQADRNYIALTILFGYLIILFFKRILFIKRGNDDIESHRIVSITAFLGFSVHSLIEGFALAVGSLTTDLGPLIFISIIAHKSMASFSLSSLFLLSKTSTKKTVGLIVLFSLMTPVGAIAFTPIFSLLPQEMLEYLTALTAGTFLYVATGDLLPEVFHTHENRWLKLLLLILGVVIMIALGHDSH